MRCFGSVLWFRVSGVQTPEIPPRFRSFETGAAARRKLPLLFISIDLHKTHLFRSVLLIPLLATAAVAGCDHGLVPPDAPPTGAIRVDISYEGHPESWPPSDSVRDLRFVAMRFVPRDTADFLQLNRIVFSDRLEARVQRQTILVPEVETGAFLYAGVAQKYGPGVFEWRPVGLVAENDGVFVVSDGDTTRVSVHVDFHDPPLFPPS